MPKIFPKLEYTTHGDELDKTISGTHELLKLQKLLQLGNEDFTPWKRSTFFKLNFSILKFNTWTQKHLTATCKNIITQTQIKTTKKPQGIEAQALHAQVNTKLTYPSTQNSSNICTGPGKNQKP